MGLFSTSSPFDPEVEKATDEKNVTEEWGQIMEICDKVTGSTGAKDCLRSIMKRVANADPHVALQALVLLDACVNNCGKNFHLEVASRDFETELRRLVSRSQPRVTEKLKSLLRKWAESPEFTKDPQLALIPSLYKKLREEGTDFTPSHQPAEQPAKLSKDPNVVSSQQEEDDIAKAIELSLRENKGATPTPVTSLYPSALSMSAPSSPPSTEMKVRALYDFEAAEDNELSFHAGDLLVVIDNSDPNWWKGSSSKGEGLFPANFVTSDLSNPEPKRSVQFNEAVQVKTLPAYEEEETEAEIDEDKIDRLLHMLHESNPEVESPCDLDLSLERQVNSMGPLIDVELERVDRKHAQLTQLSAELVGAFNLYHSLMREQPKLPSMPQYNYMPPQPMYNGAGYGGAPSMYPPPPPDAYMPPPPGQQFVAPPQQFSPQFQPPQFQPPQFAPNPPPQQQYPPEVMGQYPPQYPPATSQPMM